MTASFLSENKFLPESGKCAITGVDGLPLHVKRYLRARVCPWFESNYYVDVVFWVLPKQSTWQAMIPAVETCKLNDMGVDILADPDYWKPQAVQLVLDASVLARIITGVKIENIGGVTVVDTKLGSIMIGSGEIGACVDMGQANVAISRPDDSHLTEMVQRLWQLDHVQEKASVRTAEQQLVEDNFMNTYRRDSSGRFVVTIPLGDKIAGMGSSRAMALKRFLILEKRLARDAELHKKYCAFMREYEELGHMQRVTGGFRQGRPIYHIPHHCVTKKFRVVFDASCKTDTGISLNEVQLLGEKLQKDLFELVMRFRRHKIAISADVAMMFRQVRVAQEHWDLQRIFWRENPNLPLSEYWLTVVTYGMTSSAHNAVRAMIQCARDAGREHPEAAQAIENDFYMDDCVTGADSVEQAIVLAKNIAGVLATAGFELRKWKSNATAVINAMKSERETAMIISDNEAASVLGLKWLIDDDQFTYQVKPMNLSAKITKRLIVSRVAQLYDPNGFITPVTITGKILIQDLWKKGLDWDVELPAEMIKRWYIFWRDIINLEQFRIPRWLGTTGDGNVQLHGFADASDKAYGAVIYVRVNHGERFQTILLTSKARVAPLKLATTPRLELCAARLLAQLISNVLEEMGWEGCKYTLWCDSQVVLHWLNKEPHALKTYVANRVTDIQAKTAKENWRYISTKENPADLLSRGLSARQLKDSVFWQHGPHWLAQHENTWPRNSFTLSKEQEARREMKIVMVAVRGPSLSIYVPGQDGLVPLLDYVHDLERAINILAYVLRFVEKVRCKSRTRARRGQKSSNLPTNDEKRKASEYLYRLEQAKDFASEIKELKRSGKVQAGSHIESLRPMLDAAGILRAGGRIDRSDEKYEMKHPILIKSGSRLSWLIMSKAHQATKHGAVQVMMQYVRQRFWIPRLRSGLRSVIHKCVTCARHNKSFEQQLMAELPADRVQVGKPFLHTGVDYAGPFMVKNAGAKKKCWVAIFVCLKTRAVHIDVVMDLTSIAFIACYERFVCRRGRCERIYSDNGTTFVGTARELERAKNKWHVRDVFEHLSMKGTEWKFMTPAAPHQGGIYEAAVKSMKHHLRRVVGMRVMLLDQFTTLLVEIEAILNSRPITPLSDDIGDVQALTPGHFLIGEPLVIPLPFVTEQQADTSAAVAWQQRQMMVKHFWQRWRVEYLTTLQERKKWRRERENVRVGAMVVIKSELFPPAQWALGRISELIKSNDGLVRSVVIQTATGQLTRPIQKICILPVEGEGRG